MKFKRDYKIEVTTDMNDRTFWQLTYKGDPVNQGTEDKQFVAEMLEEILNIIKNSRTMKKEYKKQKGETLGTWVERLSQDVLWQRLEPHDIQEILHDVGATSYIEGVHKAWG